MIACRESVKLYGLAGLDNVGKVDQFVYRGAQPTEEGFVTLVSMGVKTILNLRSSHVDRFTHSPDISVMREHVPMSLWAEVDGLRVDRALQVMTSEEEIFPIFVHCAQGKDRTGLIIALYRMIHGWSYEEAEQEMQDFGFHDVWHQYACYLYEVAEKSCKRNVKGDCNG